MLVGVLVWPVGKWSADRPAAGSQASPVLATIGQGSDRQQELAGDLPAEAHVAVDSTEPPESVAAEIGSPRALQIPGSFSETSTEPDADMPATGVFATGEAAVDMLPPLPVGTETSAEPAELDSTEVNGGASSGQAEQNQFPRFDPLDLDPEGLDMASLGRIGLGRQEDFPEPTASPEESGKSLANNDPPGGVSSAARNPGELVAGARPQSPDHLNTQVVRMDPTVAAPTRMTAAEDRLEQRLAAIEIERMPLYVFLEMISGLGKVPIQLGSEELRMAAISAEAPVSVRRQQTSLAEVLHEALRPLHLDYRALGPLVMIHWPGAEKPREIDYPIADLLTPETDAARLTEWIRQLVAPTSWRAAGGEGDLQIAGNMLHIHQSQRVQYQVLCFLERLRLVRKLKPRSRYPIERLSVEPALQQLAASLHGQARFTFSRYTPLSEIFSYWQQQLGLALLVDWSAVLGEPSGARQGSLIGPATRVACAVADQPWDQALDLVLEPLGLAWRAMDGHTLQITSAQIAQEEAQLEFYPLGPGEPRGQGQPGLDQARVAAIMAELQKLVELPDSADLSRGQTALILDPVSQHLLALQPWSVQRRLWRRIDKAGAGR
jgi:hypothetical protein